MTDTEVITAGALIYEADIRFSMIEVSMRRETLSSEKVPPPLKVANL